MHKKEPIYADMNSPLIAATLAGKWRFYTHKEALEKIAAMRKLFHTKKSNQSDTLTVWIEGYQLTEEEKTKGRSGNFAVISAIAQDGGFSLQAQKLDIDQKYHPRLNRPKKTIPDWGYYVLRNVKKKRSYQTLEEAEAALAALACDFPKVTRLANAKAYVMVYSKALNPKESVQKVVLNIEVLREGGFTITWTPNTFGRKQKKSKVGDAEIHPVGKFTSMLRKK